MRYDWLLEPVSEAEPCGPDLDEAGDSAYMSYIDTTANRIPARYYDANDNIFDRAAIKLKDEVDTIRGFLEQSRDLRLLSLEARLQSFFGDIAGFSECLQAMSGLVGKFFADVHPKAFEGDLTLRQAVLGGLDDFRQIIEPLQYQPLLYDKRSGHVTFRHFAVASGAVPKRANEGTIDVSDIHRSLAAEENRAASDACFASLAAAHASLASIREAFIGESGYDYLPSFDRLNDFLGKALELFRTARPELGAEAAAEHAADGQAVSAEPGEGLAETSGDQPGAPARVAAVSSHQEAAAALLAAETYFAAHEPSAPALILVHQARSLVGKPLVQALEALLPEAAAKAVLKFEAHLNFQINMAQMKALTTQAAKGADGAGEPRAYSAGTRAEATALIGAVENFFKTAEPSSPVPMLLARATRMQNRDFGSILKELFGEKA